jgi:hypothetical protein
LGCINEKDDDVAGFQASFGSWRAWWIVVNKEASETTGCLTGEFCGLSVPHEAPRGWRAHGSETDWCVVRARVREPRPTGVMGWDDGGARRLTGAGHRSARARVEDYSDKDSSCEQRQDVHRYARPRDNDRCPQNAAIQLRAVDSKARGSALCCCTSRSRTVMASLIIALDSCSG